MTELKIAKCNGGLGNQVFQYIFSRFVELEGGEACYLDDTAFWIEQVAHNGFEISRVFPNSRPRLLSQYLTGDVWEHIMGEVKKGKGVCQQLLELGENFTLVAETDDYSYSGTRVCVPSNAYMPRLANSTGDIYYHGYWINKEWLRGKYWEQLKEELQFAPIRDEVNLQYLTEIQETQSVMLHVRRGDFVEYRWDAPAELYREGVECMKQKVQEPHFFVFSDDLAWCRQNSRELGLENVPVTYVEGNHQGNNYIDMQLMSYCKNVILITSSSFSYLATLLNQNSNVLVYNKTRRSL